MLGHLWKVEEGEDLEVEDEFVLQPTWKEEDRLIVGKKVEKEKRGRPSLCMYAATTD